MTDNSVPKSLVALGWWLHGAGLLLMAVIAAGTFLGLDRFVNRHLARIDRQHRAAAKFLETEPQAELANRELKQELADMEDRFSSVTARIPAEAGESDFLAQLSELAQQSRLAIRDYRPGISAHKEEHSEMEVDLSAEGNYTAICRFLAGLGTLSRLSRITELEISEPATDEPETYPIEMTLRIYFAPLQVASQNGESKDG